LRPTTLPTSLTCPHCGAVNRVEVRANNRCFRCGFQLFARRIGESEIRVDRLIEAVSVVAVAGAAVWALGWLLCFAGPAIYLLLWFPILLIPLGIVSGLVGLVYWALRPHPSS
jgi:uncharacterized protein (DUF983 family)